MTGLIDAESSPRRLVDEYRLKVSARSSSDGEVVQTTLFADADPVEQRRRLVSGIGDLLRDRIRLENENLRTAFGTLADEIPASESRQFGSVRAVCAGVPAPIFNRVFVFDPPPIGEVSAAVAWMSERDVPFWVTVSEPAAEEVTNHLGDLGLAKATEQPGMAMASLDEIPTRDTSVDIVEVTDPDEREDFSAVTASAFEMSLDVAVRVDRAGFAADDVRLFLGRVAGHPAGCGVLIWGGDVAGLYSIGVVEAFRRIREQVLQCPLPRNLIQQRPATCRGI